MVRRSWRSAVGALFLVIGGILLVLGLEAFAPGFGRWMAARGVRGIWAQVVFAFAFILLFGVLAAASIAISVGGSPTRQTYKALGLWIAMTALLLGWVVAVSYLVVVVRSRLWSAMPWWLHLAVLIVGFALIVVAAGRLARRIGVNMRGRGHA